MQSPSTAIVISTDSEASSATSSIPNSPLSELIGSLPNQVQGALEVFELGSAEKITTDTLKTTLIDEIGALRQEKKALERINGVLNELSVAVSCFHIAFTICLQLSLYKPNLTAQLYLVGAAFVHVVQVQIFVLASYSPAKSHSSTK